LLAAEQIRTVQRIRLKEVEEERSPNLGVLHKEKEEEETMRGYDAGNSRGSRLLVNVAEIKVAQGRAIRWRRSTTFAGAETTTHYPIQKYDDK